MWKCEYCENYNNNYADRCEVCGMPRSVQGQSSIVQGQVNGSLGCTRCKSKKILIIILAILTVAVAVLLVYRDPIKVYSREKYHIAYSDFYIADYDVIVVNKGDTERFSVHFSPNPYSSDADLTIQMSLIADVDFLFTRIPGDTVIEISGKNYGSTILKITNSENNEKLYILVVVV